MKLQRCGAWAEHRTGSRVCRKECREMASCRLVSDTDVGGGSEQLEMEQVKPLYTYIWEGHFVISTMCFGESLVATEEWI